MPAGPKPVVRCVLCLSPRSEPRQTASAPLRSTRSVLAIVKDRLGDVLLSTITRERIEGFQTRRKLDGVSNRTINMDVGALRKVLKRYGHWRRL
jgi:hypothetical protein